MKTSTCIVCPIGCRITAELKDGEYAFSGNRCARGEEFARTELTSPMRSVSTTVRTVYSHMPVLPVRTKGEIPKGKMPELIRALAAVKITRKIAIGETVVPDILNTGCDVIATCPIPEAKKEDLPC